MTGILLLVLTGFILLDPDAKAATNGKIAFDSDRDFDHEIYTMNTDGSGQANLTNNPANDDKAPAWSPDGSRIAFTSLGDGNQQIFVMNADGSGQTNLSNNSADDWGPAWSPDGSKIAFWTNRDGNYQIYVMNADGSGQTNLSNNRSNDYGPAWSPDGSKIAFDSYRDGNLQIYMMNADGSGQINLSNNTANDFWPAWSPDGSKIAFCTSRDGNFEIYSMNADGSAQTRLTNNPAFDNVPAWSPDGASIAFDTDRDGPCLPNGRCLFEIYSMNADGSGQTNLSNNYADYAADDEAPSWQSVGQRNYYWSWYDDLGSDNWVLMANPASAGNASYNLSIGGKYMDLGGFAYGIVGPGQVMHPQFSGVRDGPVKAATTNGARGLLSQRTLWPKGGDSLEEVLATEESRLSDHFWWSWYDEASPGFRNWILVSNPSPSATVHYQIMIDGELKQEGDLLPGASVEPRFPGVMGGPVEVTTTGGPVMASQRVLSNNGLAFNEMPGIPNSELQSSYLWTWYDEVSPGVEDWVLVSNPSASAMVHYQIMIDGDVKQEGDLLPGDSVQPEFPGIIGGPVQVTSTGGPVLATQRVIWGPSFGEVPGMSATAADYLWTWYDESAPGVSNWVLVSNPSASATVHYQIKIAGDIKAEGDLLPGDSVTPRFPGDIGGPVEVSSTGGDIVASQRVIWKGYFNEVLGTVLP